MTQLTQDLATRDGVVTLMRSSKSRNEWDRNCDAVKRANNGHYPGFWYEAIIQSGLARQVLEACGSDADLHVKAI